MADALLLEGKVAIVTGATRGIGRAIAETFAAHGATLIVNGSDAAALDAAAAEIRDRHSATVSAVAGDVSIPSTSSDLVRQAFSQEKRLDIFVNNAGVLIDALIGMVTDEAIERTLGVNLKGVLYGIQAAGRLMTRGGGGSLATSGTGATARQPLAAAHSIDRAMSVLVMAAPREDTCLALSDLLIHRAVAGVLNGDRDVL